MTKAHLNIEHAADVARRAAVAGADAAVRRFYEGVARELKADGSFVTVADRAAEDAILTILRREFPSHAILTEESGAHAGDSDSRWIIDPLDGTHRFARGLPRWGSLVALEHRGAVVAAALSMPVVGEVCWAGRGLGCWHNDRRLRVSKVSDWSQANLSLGSLRRILDGPAREGTLRLIATCDYTVTGGDLAGGVAVLLGHAEAWVEAGVKPWDVAPFSVMVEEAGGRFTDIAGARTVMTGSAVVTNGLLHDHVLRELGAPRPRNSSP